MFQIGFPVASLGFYGFFAIELGFTWVILIIHRSHFMRIKFVVAFCLNTFLFSLGLSFKKFWLGLRGAASVEISLRFFWTGWPILGTDLKEKRTTKRICECVCSTLSNSQTNTINEFVWIVGVFNLQSKHVTGHAVFVIIVACKQQGQIRCKDVCFCLYYFTLFLSLRYHNYYSATFGSYQS